MRKKLPLFYRYLLSYIVLLLIPILLIGLLVYQRFVGILQEEITLGHRHVLEQARTAFESKLGELDKIAINLSSKPELSPDRLNRSMSYAIDAMSELRSTVTNPFVYQMALYLKDNEYMYAPNSTYPVSMFASDIYRYADWPEDRFLRDIRGLKKPLLRPAEPLVAPGWPEGRALTYLVPVPYNSPAPYGALLFLIDEKSVSKLLEGTLEERNGNSLILDRNGQVVAALHHEAYLKSEAFAQAVHSPVHGMAAAKFDGITYAVSTLKLDYDGWTYVTMLPESDFMKKANLVRVQFFTSVLIVLLIGSALIYMLMRLNYRPLDKLLAFVGKQWGDAVRSVHDAYGTIGRMAEDHQLLRMKLHNHKEATRNHLLLGLLRGKACDIGSWNASGSEVGIAFTKPLYFVVIIDCPGQSEYDRNRMEDRFQASFENFRVDTTDEATSTFICAVTEEESSDRHAALLRLHRELADCGTSVTIGAGELYGDIGQVGKSYIEASTALNYKLIKGSNTLIAYGEIRAEQADASWYPKEELEHLAQYMRQGDSAKVEDILYMLQNHMQQRRLPLHIARCICYDIMGCTIKAHSRLKPAQGDGMPYPDVFSLAKFDTMQDLVSLVRHICLQVKKSMEPEQGEAQAWLSYIREHGTTHDFSVQGMADQFAVSRSYLNASFKKHTGQTVMDYLDGCRLEQAKHLLAGSDLQLKDVVQRIGYYDVSSFIRKFKQKLQLTPGEFRKLYSAADNDAPKL